MNTYNNFKFSAFNFRRTVTWFCATLHVDDGVSFLHLPIQLIAVSVQISSTLGNGYVRRLLHLLTVTTKSLLQSRIILMIKMQFCNFMFCYLVLHFHVLHFHVLYFHVLQRHVLQFPAMLLGPTFSCPAFSRPAFSPYLKQDIERLQTV